MIEKKVCNAEHLHYSEYWNGLNSNDFRNLSVDQYLT